MPQWNLTDTKPYEKEMDKFLGEMLNKYPDIGVQVMAASLANILTEILNQAPSAFRHIVLHCMIKGERVKLEKKQDG